jgi:putative toxin-antitoxin system antitoxin component (TIGR02293 family)
MKPLNIASVLGGKKAVRTKIRSRMDLVDLGTEGVTKEALLRLVRYLEFSIDQMAEILPVTKRTIQRYSSKQRFNQVVSEQIITIAEVTARGSVVFESKDDFLVWIRSSIKALGNRTPRSLLGSRFGTEMVLDELGRMEHGVMS